MHLPLLYTPLLMHDFATCSQTYCVNLLTAVQAAVIWLTACFARSTPPIHHPKPGCLLIGDCALPRVSTPHCLVFGALQVLQCPQTPQGDPLGLLTVALLPLHLSQEAHTTVWSQRLLCPLCLLPPPARPPVLPRASIPPALNPFPSSSNLRTLRSLRAPAAYSLRTQAAVPAVEPAHPTASSREEPE